MELVAGMIFIYKGGYYRFSMKSLSMFQDVDLVEIDGR